MAERTATSSLIAAPYFVVDMFELKEPLELATQ